eukprot:1141633-Pelagomonas_calceolata.AAC.2
MSPLWGARLCPSHSSEMLTFHHVKHGNPAPPYCQNNSSVSKGPFRAGLASMDIGSTDRLALQNLEIPEHLTNKPLPKYIFPRATLAARFYLNNQNPTCLQGLDRDIPKAKWFVKDVSNDLIRNARHAVTPGIGKCEKLPLDKKQIAKAPCNPATDITAPVPCQSNQTSSSKFSIGSPGTTQTAAARFRTFLVGWAYGAGVHHPVSDSKNLVEPNGAGITNTIGRAKLAALAAARTHEHTHTLPQTASAHFTNSESKSCIQRSTDIMCKKMF